MSFKNLKPKIINILRRFPESRNNDTTLMILLWQEFFREKIGDNGISFKSLYLVPQEDDIKRLRAVIQNTEKDRRGVLIRPEDRYLPTDPVVAKMRLKNQYAKLLELGYFAWQHKCQMPSAFRKVEPKYEEKTSHLFN